jgi:hypothetical protein
MLTASAHSGNFYSFFLGNPNIETCEIMFIANSFESDYENIVLSGTKHL